MGLPPCPAYDFSCAFRGTLARTVEPGEKGMPANFNEDSAAFALSIKPTFSGTTSQPTKSNLFQVAHASRVIVPVRLGLAASSLRPTFFAIISFFILSRKDKFEKTRHLRQHAGRPFDSAQGRQCATRAGASLPRDRSHRFRTR